MIINEIDLDVKCTGASFELGLLKFTCVSGNTMTLVMIPSDHPQYLDALKWAIAAGYI